MQRDEIIEEISRRTFRDGDVVKLSCAQAFAAAEKCGVAKREISTICNDQNIKICQCQLGCFS